MSCKMVQLSSDDIKEDLKNADPDDVVFNKNLFAKLTGKGINTKNELSKEDKCYNDVLQFLHGEEELRNLIQEIKIKQDDLADMKEQLEEWMVKLSGGDNTNEETAPAETAPEVNAPEVTTPDPVNENIPKEENEEEDIYSEEIADEIEEGEEVALSDLQSNLIGDTDSTEKKNSLDDSSDSTDDLNDVPCESSQAILEESSDSNEIEGDTWEVEDDDLVIDDSD